MLTRRTFTRLGLGFSIAAAWIVILLRIQPWPFSDYGVFLAVARRLAAGDVLYQGVWDNKDPFVYYSIALAQPLGQLGLWALETLWFVIASIATYGISRHYVLSRYWSLLIGAVLVPVALLPFHYFPGTTHLPGVALSLLGIALFLGHRQLLTGVALGLLFFFKLTMVPIAAAAILVIVLRQRSPRALVPTSLGALITLGVGAAVLVLRGEFAPYLASLVHNVAYSQTNTDSGATGVGAVIAERLTVFSDIHVLITIMTILVVLVTTFIKSGTSEIWLLAASTFIVGLALIAVIGKFPHHAQVLGVSATLTLVTCAVAVQRLRDATPLLAVGLLVAITIGLTGWPSTKGYRDALRNPQGTWVSMTTLDSATLDLINSGPPRSFAVVEGAGIPRSEGLETWDLACRHLAQRPWESDELLGESLECFPSAEVLLVPRNFTTANSPEAFRQFTANVALLLEEGYTCVPATANTVCTRVDPGEAK